MVWNLPHKSYWLACQFMLSKMAEWRNLYDVLCDYYNYHWYDRYHQLTVKKPRFKYLNDKFFLFCFYPNGKSIFKLVLFFRFSPLNAIPLRTLSNLFNSLCLFKRPWRGFVAVTIYISFNIYLTWLQRRIFNVHNNDTIQIGESCYNVAIL